MAWYDLPITNPYGYAGGEANLGGHSGVDFGTANNTPLTMPMSGTVIGADYKPWGGEVAIATNAGVIEYMLHLNSVYVHVGDTITANTVVGTSGGGVGDKLRNAAGQVITTVSQGQFNGFSTGYHTHFGLVKGTSYSQWQQALGPGGVSLRIDPTDFINTWRGKGNVAAASSIGVTESPTKGGGSTLVNAANENALLSDPVSSAIQGALQPAITAFDGGLNNVMSIVLIGFVALVCLGIGLAILLDHPAAGGGGGSMQTAATIAKIAAVA